MSCAKNVMMKSIQEPIAPPKGVFKIQPSTKAHLTYELDRIRKHYNRYNRIYMICYVIFTLFINACKLNTFYIYLIYMNVINNHINYIKLLPKRKIVSIHIYYIYL